MIAVTSAAYVVIFKMRQFSLLAVAVLVAASCAGGGPTAVVHSPSPVAGALTGGLIAYVADQGVGVLDPATGKAVVVAPMPAGAAFRVVGPVWGPAPGLPYPVVYFTVHDDRPAERRTTTGVVPYDWLFRVDPFTGSITPLAASANLGLNQSEGPLGLIANGRYLALTLGVGVDYEVDALDLTQPSSMVRVVTKPPAQAALFTEGAAPGPSGLLAVRAVGTGAWYWLNLDANVLNPFPLPLGPDDGPIAISSDGALAAVSRPNQGPVIEPINVTLPVASAAPTAVPTATGTPAAVSPVATKAPATPHPSAAPRPVNSNLPHADGLAWSPDANQLAIAVNGELEIYNAGAADGPPAAKYPAGGGVIGIDWSVPIADQSLALVKPSAGPQTVVDALLTATQLPAAADSPEARPLTKVYLWQYDSSKPSPIASIADATASVLQQYPPLAAGVVFHHWAPSVNWELLGGCYRYRVVITGSIPPVASTFGLGGNTPCNAPPSPTPSPTRKATQTATKSP
ncbi:MAG TPA: hypothetical protein VGU71_05465 [Candidatus Dormibacteraeota bacterium]|nr:hypothetical protein [Candidatus Dormibacteraeota bacterium]